VSIVLVAVDGSESGERAVLRAGEVAHDLGASVLVLHVLPSTFERERVAQLDPASTDVEESFAQGIIDRALTLLAERGLRAEGRVIQGAPAQTILSQINELRPVRVIMGSRGRASILPEGSVSRRVREASDVVIETVE
jgi:nucleotide-binding universal stress UspA family protein